MISCPPSRPVDAYSRSYKNVFIEENRVRPIASADTKERMAPRAPCRRRNTCKTWSLRFQKHVFTKTLWVWSMASNKRINGHVHVYVHVCVFNRSLITCRASVLTWSLASPPPCRCITRFCHTRASVASSSSGHGSQRRDVTPPHAVWCVQTFYHNSANPLIKRQCGVM